LWRYIYDTSFDTILSIYLLLVQSMYRDMYISYHVSQVGTIHRGCEVVCMLHVNYILLISNGGETKYTSKYCIDSTTTNELESRQASNGSVNESDRRPRVQTSAASGRITSPVGVEIYKRGCGEGCTAK